MNQIFTIGHSNHDIQTFIHLLKQHDIKAVCDVRSVPYSRYTPQFNCDPLRDELKKAGLMYVYLGKELGPRSQDPSCYVDGKVQFDLLSRSAEFKDGLDRIKTGIETYRVALMCSEKDPAVCHRTILVCRYLRRADIDIVHILEDGRLESNRDLERRLMRMLKIPEQTLFDDPEDQIQRAYDLQGCRIAYQVKHEDSDNRQPE